MKVFNYTSQCLISADNENTYIFCSYSNNDKDQVIAMMVGQLTMANMMKDMKVESLSLNNNFFTDSTSYTVEEFMKLLK
jgi:hypothetical protein